MIYKLTIILLIFLCSQSYMFAQQSTDNYQKSKSYYEEGKKFTQDEKWEEAEKSFKMSLKLNPKDQDTRFALGHIYYIEKKWNQAQEELETVIQESPKYIDAYIILGHIALIKNDSAKAKDYFLRALEIDPKNTKAIKALKSLTKEQDPLIGQAAALMDKKEYQKAAQIYEQLIKKHPETGSFSLLCGQAYSLQKKWDKAFQCFNQYQKKYPRDKYIYFYIAQALYWKGDLSKAKEHLT